MIESAFEHRSGRMIAAGRTVIATFFLIAIWLDHTQPALAAPETYAILGAYVALSAAVLALSWNDWWLESRLALPAHAADLLILLWLNYATQGYTSPFFTFFVFLILAASIRWGWRGTAAIAAIIIPLYVASALTAVSWGTEAFEWRRFAIRSSYLIVLSAMVLLWLLTQRPRAGAETVAPAAEPPPKNGEGPAIAAVMETAARRFGAPRALFVWNDREEPWTYVARLERGKFEMAKYDPGRFDPPVSPGAECGPFLFEQARGRILTGGPGRRRVLRSMPDPVHPGLASEFGAERGICVPVRSSRVAGDLLLLDVPGLCSDDIELAEAAAGEAAAALKHRELFDATEEAAEIRARLSLARDLHDSVVQVLAGLALRLEGIKKRASAGRDIADEVRELQRDLAGEQRDLRLFIAELRGDCAGDVRSCGDLTVSLRELSERSAAQWGVGCRVVAGPDEIKVTPALEQNVRQLVREAVANAVRHGGATEIETRLERDEGRLQIEIRDNGGGFPLQGEFGDQELRDRRIGPSSLHERVAIMGGTLRLASHATGSTLSIDLPLESAA
jgi:signal transduction histidine kinase